MKPTDATRATAQAMPEINRRLMLAVVPAAAVTDPLLDAIKAFQTAMQDYCDNAPDDSDEADAYAEVSYVPAMKVLEHWDSPATSRQGAIEAVRLAAKEAHDFASSELLQPLLNAAVAYFEQEGGAA